MADRRGWGATVAGWFVERDEDSRHSGAAETGEDIGNAPPGGTQNSSATLPGGAEYAASSPTQGVFQTPPPAAVGGQVDFDAVFTAAGVDTEERQRVGKTIELLRGLPAGTDAAVKKQIVEAALKAFGVPIEKIIEASVEELQALDGYVRNAAADNEKLIQESDARIKQYEEEIKNIRAVMQQSVEEQQTLIKVCNEKKLEVQQVLEFFGQEAVARVVKASPKLHDPSSPAETSAT
jgi:DNA repair protein RadC